MEKLSAIALVLQASMEEKRETGVSLNLSSLPVHAVRNQFPLCGFTHIRLDRGWPPGSLWTEVKNKEQVTCPGCLARIDEPAKKPGRPPRRLKSADA